VFSKREDEPIRPAAAPHSALPPTAVAARREHQAAIGPSISIVGDVTGGEDLTILGRVRGKIDLPQHTVTVEETGHIDADIHAKVVSVAGEVHGNLVASEQILIRKTATMLGNLTAPRVGLEEGCRFRGSVDMKAQPEKGQTASTPTLRASGAASPATRDEAAVEPTGSPGGGMPAKPERQLVRP
jgi:cytoskeletal protein CcmA (bactofilin family)